MSLEPNIVSAIKTVIDSYPLRHDPKKIPLNYGTAGFRAVGTYLSPVVVRVALIATLRSWWCTQYGKTGSEKGVSIGIMITASHNPSQDNGFKIIDHNAGMLEISWEKWCTQAANASTSDELISILETCLKEENISLSEARIKSNAVIRMGIDTRSTGPEIAIAARKILDAMKIKVIDYGLLTTPQLHFIVETANSTQKIQNDNLNVELYEKQLITSFQKLIQTLLKKRPNNKKKIIIDAANGIGAIALERLFDYSRSHKDLFGEDIFQNLFDISIINNKTEDQSKLNFECGADYTQKERKVSAEMLNWAKSNSHLNNEDVHYYSIDGDADRVVAFYFDPNSTQIEQSSFSLLDGDRFSILYALFIRKVFGSEILSSLDCGVVQTAYANGASSSYIEKELGIKVYTAATGVKNIHPVAHALDIGVYFEANGHGTVLFNRDCKDKLKRANLPLSEEIECALHFLPRLLSQACGDALGDLFCCELALLYLDMNFYQWLNMYHDLPSIQEKVVVPNPKAISNTTDERRCTKPEGIQEEIDAAMMTIRNKYKLSCRSFLRPSGTEPIVRVYAEAETKESCEELAKLVRKIAEKYCQ